MANPEKSALPSYASYLPPLCLREAEGFLVRFLGLLEALMAGLPEPAWRQIGGVAGKVERLWGLEQLLDRIHLYSDPLSAPGPDTSLAEEVGGPSPGYFDEDFLDYLAGWVALTLKKRWPAAKKRRLIQQIVPLYKKRGTPGGIREFLRIFVENPVEVREELGFQVGVRASVGVDTIVGGWPHLFKVEIRYGFREENETAARRFDVEFLKFIRENTVEILDLEKPAHTDYRVLYNLPGIVVGKYATVGWDTLIWTRIPIEIAGG